MRARATMSSRIGQRETPWEATPQNFADALVLLDDLLGKGEFEAVVTPGFENLGRRAGKEHARDQDIGVQDDSHPALRTRVTARVTSD